MITANKVTPAIGAVLTGVDFSRPLDAATHDAIYQALLEHLVIFFRDVEITPSGHLDFAQAFGELDQPHPLYPHVEGFDRVMVLENDADRPPDTDSWHTDLTYKSEQPFASILVARHVPQVGGDTMWSSSYAAYDRLPEGMKTDLATLEVVHDSGDFRNSFAGSDAEMNAGMARMGSAIKPLIGTHPVTGRKFLNFNPAFCTHVLGKTSDDSNALKTWLTGHMNRPEDQIRWRWSANDMAMWDNRVTMHYAIADYLPAYRCMNRVTVVRDGRAQKTANAA
ncbi:MAG: TauD/TfdA family dioxygenase [Pseudomonadota bacterium]